MHNSTHKFDSTRMCHQPSLTSLALFFVLGAGSLTAEHVHTHIHTLMKHEHNCTNLHTKQASAK